jgi:hypothetical protein
MFTYSTARTLLNMALVATGLPPIESDDAYSDLTQLDKYQRQGTLLLDLMQRKLGIAFNSRRFMRRKFTFKTKDYNTYGTTEYEVPGAFIIEGFKANSFTDVTVNGQGMGHVRVIGYEYWKKAYPDPATVPIGAPELIVIPPDDGSGVPKLIIHPYSDREYTIEGICRLITQPITKGSQFVVFPQHYEHVLVFKLCQMLEGKLNEGREVSAEKLADEAVAEVLRDAVGADEEENPIDFGFTLFSGRRGNTTRDFNPATDIPTPYNP